MRIQNVLIYEVDEVQELLIDWYTDKLMSDREFAKQCVENHTMYMPPIKSLNEMEIATEFSKLTYLADLARRNGADVIMVKVGKYNLIQIYERPVNTPEEDEVPF